MGRGGEVELRVKKGSLISFGELQLKNRRILFG